MAFPMLTQDQRLVAHVATNFIDQHIRKSLPSLGHFKLESEPMGESVRIVLSTIDEGHTFVSRTVILPRDGTATIEEKCEDVVNSLMRSESFVNSDPNNQSQGG